MLISEQIFFTVIDMILQSVVFWGIYDLNIRNNKKECILIVMLLVLEGVVELFFEIPQPINVIVSTLVFSIIIKYVMKESNINSLLMSILSIAIMFIVQFNSVLVLLLLFEKFEKNFIYGLISEIISVINVILIIKFKNKYNYSFRDKNKTYYVLVIGSILFFSAYIVKIWHNNYEVIQEHPTLLGIFIVLLVFFGTNIKEVSKLEEKNKVVSQLSDMTEDMLGEIRASNHEVGNHLQVINSVTKLGMENLKYDDDYMKSVYNKMNLAAITKLKSHLIMALLFSKIKEAERKSIDFEVIINKMDDINKLTEYEAIEVIGCFLDNAFETYDADNNSVIFKLYSVQDEDIIEVLNAYPPVDQDEVETFFQKGYSRKGKAGKRGYGLYNVSKILKNKDIDLIVENEIIDDKNYLKFMVHIV